ncbi:MAG: hypothetical protein II892_10670 [Fibrobacter sp.]|jgi:hypothetical protein|nr:hypothetical protein [Fibrobacter sp.]MBQ3777222.1 hypothetical protein [Fibrobacter sp.]
MFSRFIYFSLFIVLLGCAPYEDPSETECFDSDDFLSIRLITTANIDSVQFYLNEQYVCQGQTNASQKIILCNDSTKRAPVYIQPTSQKISDHCVVSESYPIWNVFLCGITPFDDVKPNSNELGIQIFSNDTTTHIKTGLITTGRTRINIVPEQDTTKWFSYDENPIDVTLHSSDMSKRMGCFEGYCVTTLPMTEKEFCYEKDSRR